MPLNCIPVTTTAEAFAAKESAIEDRVWVDVCFIGGIVSDNASSPSQLTQLMDCGPGAVKSFMCHSGIDEFSHISLKDLNLATPILVDRQVPLFLHAELQCEHHKYDTHTHTHTHTR